MRAAAPGSYTLSLHDALPIWAPVSVPAYPNRAARSGSPTFTVHGMGSCVRSEEHTSELQSRPHLVCRLPLEKKKFLLRRRVDAGTARSWGLANFDSEAERLRG